MLESDAGGVVWAPAFAPTIMNDRATLLVRSTAALATLLIIAAALLGGRGELAAQAATPPGIVLRIATLAPRGSPWHRVFTAWNNTLRQATQNRLGLQILPGAAGDEDDFVDRMRSGQLDGAALSSLGLGRVVRETLVLQAPGLFNDYAQLDRARTTLDATFRAEFEANGTVLLGWGDVGQGRLFSTRRLEHPSELRDVRPWQPTSEVMFAEYLRVVGAQGVILGVPEVLPALGSQRIDTLVASATVASALQWNTRLSFVTRQHAAMLIGATILDKRDFDALAPDLQTTLLDTARQAHESLNRTIRRDDERYYQALLGRGLTEVDLSATQAEWTRVGQEARERLVGRIYSRDILDRVIAAARGR